MCYDTGYLIHITDSIKQSLYFLTFLYISLVAGFGNMDVLNFVTKSLSFVFGDLQHYAI